LLYSGFTHSELYKISPHSNGVDIFYSGLVDGPRGTFLMKEDISAGTIPYMKTYGKAWNLNSHELGTNKFYCMTTGTSAYILEINNDDGVLESAITPTTGYKWDKSYWSLALSLDEELVFFSSINSSNIGIIWIWEVGDYGDITCIELGNLHIPLFISRISGDNVFIQAYDETLAGDLYFVYISMDNEDTNWSK